MTVMTVLFQLSTKDNSMITNETDMLIQRINRFNERLKTMLTVETIPLRADYAHCAEPVLFPDRLRLDYKPIEEGAVWGNLWESAWFRLTAQVPKEWKNQPLVAHLDFTGEGLVFDSNGIALQGITSSSIFDPDYARPYLHLGNEFRGGEELELWLETAANGMFGVFLDQNPLPGSRDRFGHFEAKIVTMRLAVFDMESWHLWLDIRTLLGLVNRLPEKSVRRAKLIRSLNQAVNIFGADRANARSARQHLQPELEKPANASDPEVTAIGHAHIDTGWLWPVRESVRKCARTFSAQLALIDKYDNYIFGASQPQHYEFTKTHYPEIYRRIKKAHQAGRWELQGGMWVEADCNLISGESMIRQILHGKNFFMDEFGEDVDNLWLPDVFGYSAAMPQILRKSGIHFFLTQKLSWSQFNEFPHHTFLWRGIDGSEIMTHFPPENTYNSQLDTHYLVPAAEHFKEKDFINEFISVFGVGNGGGGPKEENLELGRRMSDLEGAPKVRFGTAKSLFDKLRKYEDEVQTWSGELYLEYHRGTLTSQALVKKQNRQLEQQLRAVEFLWSCLPAGQYPARDLDDIWKKVLINQFHDILPGSSINLVYQTTHAEYNWALEQSARLLAGGANALFRVDENRLVLMNVLHYPFTGAVTLPENWQGCRVTDEHGNELPVQSEKEITVALVAVAPYSFLTLHKQDAQAVNETEQGGLILENDLVRYQFSEAGELLGVRDKVNQKEILQPGQQGNVLTLYDDHPNNWDAWDIEFYYRDAVLETAQAVSSHALGSGSVRSGIRFERKVGNSRIRQDVYLEQGTARLDFHTTVDWQEKKKMLRVAFPVNVRSDFASYDIQYGYVRRATHRNTMWEKAKFEVPAHRYADLSDHDYGVALLNDCKYGYYIHDNVMDLNLLRGPDYPDADADLGQHEFTYALYPHTGDLLHSDVMAQAAQLNQGIRLFAGYSSTGSGPVWQLRGEGLSLESVKKAEKEDCLVLRIVETLGRHSAGTLNISDSAARLVETNLMEWENGKEFNCSAPLPLKLDPFEIRTYKLYLEK
jgi:alpha-mannosidase